jgi:hypothetical protein
VLGDLQRAEEPEVHGGSANVPAAEAPRAGFEPAAYSLGVKKEVRNRGNVRASEGPGLALRGRIEAPVLGVADPASRGAVCAFCARAERRFSGLGRSRIEAMNHLPPVFARTAWSWPPGRRRPSSAAGSRSAPRGPARLARQPRRASSPHGWRSSLAGDGRSLRPCGRHRLAASGGLAEGSRARRGDRLGFGGAGSGDGPCDRLGVLAGQRAAAGRASQCAARPSTTGRRYRATVGVKLRSRLLRQAPRSGATGRTRGREAGCGGSR